uniref:uncharacterized protein LOC120342532 n=1 Tax=Styela clava TaxID=7725 RepID=UPI00193A156A|nr:uncharacterized protein LOC120342532 [Styela clava]
MNLSITITFLLAGFSFVNSANDCKAPNLVRTDLQGNISYSSNLRYEECTWKLPTVDQKNNILFIFLQEIFLTFTESGRTECAGNLILPELGPICRMPLSRCILYIPENIDCDVIKVDTYIKKNLNISQCSNKLWYDVNTIPEKIQTKANYPDFKNFSLSYNIIECPKKVQAFNVAPDKTSSSQTGNENSTKSNDNNSKSSSSTTFIIVIVILIVLLISIIIVTIGRSRLKRLRRDKPKSPQKPPPTTGYVFPSEIQQIGLNDQTPSPTDDEILSTNHYEEIAQTRVERSESREYISNVIY